MMTRRRWLSNQHGFTLAELVVVAAVMGLLMAGVFALQRQGQEAYLLGSSRVETQQNARVALDLMTRELRSATSVTTPTTATDITFVDQTGRTIRYSVAGATLNRTVNGITSALIGGVQSLFMTGYSVYDVYNNTYTTTTCGTTVGASCPQPALVKVIKISVQTNTEKGVATGSPGDQHATMECTIKLRATLS
jgi:prepilin-type N-terminal cleavage/methylation domain-containing protein